MIVWILITGQFIKGLILVLHVRTQSTMQALIDDDEKEKITTILFIMDRFSISLEGNKYFRLMFFAYNLMLDAVNRLVNKSAKIFQLSILIFQFTRLP